MQFPRIHLNGTSRETLTQQYRDAAIAVQAAIKAVEAIEVHARDYYVISEKAVNEAMREHHRRIAALKEVYTDLTMIYERIDE